MSQPEKQVDGSNFHNTFSSDADRKPRPLENNLRSVFDSLERLARQSQFILPDEVMQRSWGDDLTKTPEVIIANSMVYYPERQVDTLIGALPRELRRLVFTIGKDVRPDNPISLTYQFGAGMYENDTQYHAFDVKWDPGNMTDAASVHIEPELHVLDNPEIMSEGEIVLFPDELFEKFEIRNKRGIPLRFSSLDDDTSASYKENMRATRALGTALLFSHETHIQWLTDLTAHFDSPRYN